MATATETLKNFVDGELVESAEGRTSAVINPSTGEEIAQAPDSSAEDVERAVPAATAAFEPSGAPRRPSARRCCSRSPR